MEPDWTEDRISVAIHSNVESWNVKMNGIIPEPSFHAVSNVPGISSRGSLYRSASLHLNGSKTQSGFKLTNRQSGNLLAAYYYEFAVLTVVFNTQFLDARSAIGQIAHF